MCVCDAPERDEGQYPRAIAKPGRSSACESLIHINVKHRRAHAGIKFVLLAVRGWFRGWRDPNGGVLIVLQTATVQSRHGMNREQEEWGLQTDSDLRTRKRSDLRPSYGNSLDS